MFRSFTSLIVVAALSVGVAGCLGGGGGGGGGSDDSSTESPGTNPAPAPTPTPANQSPSFTSAPVTSATEGQTYTYVVTATDPDGDTLAFSLTTSPTGMTLSGTGPTSRTITWTPTNAQVGTRNVSVRVADPSNAFAVQPFSITVVPAQALAISTATLPAGEAGVAYTANVSAQGGVAPYVFSLAPGSTSLHTGLSLTTSGAISGTPSQTGTRSITVRAVDAVGAVATRALSLTVDPAFVLTPDTTDPVQPGEQVSIAIAGGLAPYVAILAENVSGAELTLAGSLATYTAGTGSGVDTVDVFDARGRVRTVEVTVQGEAFAGFFARFGLHDNWQLNFDAKRDASHSYRTDFERELVRLGLRTDGAFDAGQTHDQLALELVKLKILSHTGVYFGLDAHGNPTETGYPISFFAAAPTFGTAPNPGTSLNGAADRYNIMEMSSQGPPDNTVGRAFLNLGNGRVEHNALTSSGTALGVDVADITRFYVSGHASRLLVSNPINAADTPTLRALLEGEAPSGTRATAIDGLIDHYAFRVALIVAHEVGHSVGLDHNGTTGESIMATSASFGNNINPAFTSSDQTLLDSNLPGSGRLAGATAAAMTDGGSPDWIESPIVEMRMGPDGTPRCGHCEARAHAAR